MHLHPRTLGLEKGSPAVHLTGCSTPYSVSASFDITRHVSLVPPFCESEVNSYLCAFEHIVSALN